MIYDTMLVTGCGGDIALSLARLAREAAVVRRLVGCDIHEHHPAAAFFDEVVVAPRATDEVYLDWLRDFVSTRGINVLVPMSEAEIDVLLGNDGLREFANVPVVAPNPSVAEICLDKFKTAQSLLRLGLPAPWTVIVGEAAPLSLPCIIKPRRGQGSKGVARVDTQENVRRLAESDTPAIWQELLLPDDQEYTCGLYRTKKGETRSIVLRRRMSGGLTVSGTVVGQPEIEDLLERLAEGLDLQGAINVQLRLTADGPRIFEINPRFSSTVGFRHRLGFQDFIWSLEERNNLTPGDYRRPISGTRFFRVSQELILPRPPDHTKHDSK